MTVMPRRVLALVTALLPLPAAAQDFDTVQVRAVHVAGGVHMLTGMGGNIGVSVGKDGAFLVDDQFAPLTDKIRAAVDALGAGAVRFVLNTHWHPDHSGGNENLGQAGALIVAHDNVRTRMSSDQFIEFFDMAAPASPPGALPVVTFTDAVTFHLNDDEIHAVHVPPAHTDGDAIVHFRRANVIHMGDLYMTVGYPFVDRSSGGSLRGIVAAYDRALAMSDERTRIIPGHGPLSDRAQLRAYRDMVATILERVQTLKAEGKTLEQVVAARPTAEYDAQWGRGFVPPEGLIGFAYADARQ